MTQPIQAHLHVSGQEDEPRVHAVRGTEQISTPFAYEVDFSVRGIDPEKTVCGLACIALQDEQGVERYACGVVERLQRMLLPGDNEGELTRMRALLRPHAFVVLGYRRGYRIFQNLSVPQIVQQVCTDAGLDAAKLDWAGVSGTYLPRVYCVQYDESEWDFVNRVLEDEGIYYTFEHDADGHRMMFFDSVGAASALDPGALPFTLEPGLSARSTSVWDWTAESRIAVSHVVLNDYDLLRPSADLVNEASAGTTVERTWYEYPAGYTDAGEGARRARVRLDEHRAARAEGTCRTNALLAQPGHTFELIEHPDHEGSFFVTRVRLMYRAEDTAGDRPLTDAGSQQLELELGVIPKEQQFRPPRRTARPRVFGFQTARVTGPSGEEIHCDEHGRVKVQFHWDRDGELDERSSSFLRVAQAHTTGSIMIPRIGWEVLVEFIDGDPDRPVCLGKLWNPFYPPPKPLPESKTQTSHSSASSPGGQGVNEVVFDDTAGSERIAIAGQADINVNAANNQLISTGNQASYNVTGTRTAKVGGNETIAVKADHSSNVGGSHNVSVGGNREVSVSGSATEEITGAFSLTVGGMEMIQVGSPGAAVLEALKAAAINAATGAAAKAASRVASKVGSGAAAKLGKTKAAAALLGPITPALKAASQALGPAAQLAGPAAAMLAGGNPKIAALSQAVGILATSPGAAGAGQIAASLAGAAVTGQLGEGPGAARKPAAPGSENSAGAGGGAGAGAAAGPSGATGGGAGVWGVVAGGAVSETVGGANVINSGTGISIGIGGSSKEIVGAARIELIRGGKSETTGAAKIETVGIYMINAGKDVSISAKAIALNIAGVQKQSISGGHSISADGPVLVTAPQLKLKGSGAISLVCGGCKVVIDGSGISVEGADELTFEGGKIELDETALGS